MGKLYYATNDFNLCQISIIVQKQLFRGVKAFISCLKMLHTQRGRKDFLIGGAQSETTHRVVSNLYNNL